MAAHEYYMPTNWRVRADIWEVYEICSDFEGYARWWPEVYLGIHAAGKDAETGNDVFAILSKGKLPYKLRWTSCKTVENAPHALSLKAAGDLAGRGTWKFEQDGEYVNIRFDWYVNADKPLLKYLSPILKPVFRSNHYWAMDRGRESLDRELARRHKAEVSNR
ncbi:SRPBCC family protein [Cohnella hashimotonis]|uniref:SRPBCC family protein n=1 Tax=Cohnella hashimotonis TaxID=2826895 RepID=A0ABT6T9Q9_9BACL|nr:SRPBCC family protein [Cohnella hashimotonis]MDI4643499.1 SRPBCC family protein [Cohnella hashimotonis]